MTDTMSSVKVKGLNLKGKQAANIINPETYSQQVMDLVNGIESHLKVSQTRQYTRFSTCTSKMTLKEFTFSNLS